MKVSYNITQNKIKVSFKTGYYPLPVGLENYYTKNEVNVLFNQTYDFINNSFADYNNTIQTQFLDYYTKVDINSQFLNYYTKTEVDTALQTKQANLGFVPENIANKQNTLSPDGTGEKYTTVDAVNSGLNNKLDKGTYTGTAYDLLLNAQNLSQSLQNEQIARVNADLLKQDKLSSYDESILIETDGNIEGNVSLFEEYFEQQVCELNFIPIQIIGVYVNGIKQKPSSYTITLPKTISVTNYTTGDYIEIQYTKLKN